MMTCHMICHSNSPHLSQVYAGFTLLQRSGALALSQECRKQTFFDATKPQHLRDARHAHLLVLLNDSIKLYYDTHDSHEIDEEAAAAADYYFKRSYAPSKVPHALRAKVFPLGLNYELYPEGRDPLEEQRVEAFGPESNGRSLAADPQANPFRPTPDNMSAPPDSLQEPKVIFMTRAWDPLDNPDRNRQKREERITINETRARCIELLRREFGDRFQGGFERTEYALKNFGQMLLEDDESSAQGNYVELLGRHTVGVATTGLHQSIGWKLGEYVAFSKAIVSERLSYRLPGRFRAGENFLEFDEPRQCVSAVRRLLSDAALRDRMMRSNYRYYLDYLKPDVLIRRTLDIGLSKAGKR
jgi:hypothetical protein